MNNNCYVIVDLSGTEKSYQLMFMLRDFGLLDCPVIHKDIIARWIREYYERKAD